MIAPEPMRSVPSSRADGCSDGISAFTCTVAGSTRPIRLTAAFTARTLDGARRGTQAGFVTSGRLEAADAVHGA